MLYAAAETPKTALAGSWCDKLYQPVHQQVYILPKLTTAAGRHAGTTKQYRTSVGTTHHLHLMLFGVALAAAPVCLTMFDHVLHQLSCRC
jgi:hypothetical protein